MLEIVKHWEDRFEPKSQHHKKNRIVWATQFTKLLQLFIQEKKLKPEEAIVYEYKNLSTLTTKLTNYKKLSQILPNTDNSGSYPCGKCALCGNFKNYKNMVKTVGSIISHSSSKKFNLKQHLTCKNYGIYGAECKSEWPKFISLKIIRACGPKPARDCLKSFSVKIKKIFNIFTWNRSRIFPIFVPK